MSDRQPWRLASPPDASPRLLEKDLQNKNKTAFLSQTHLRKKTFKIKLGLERLSSWLRIKLFRGQTVVLKFPYLGRSRFFCSQQRGPGHLGSMAQENMQRTTNLFFLWLLPNGRWLGRYQSRRYDAAKSRNVALKGLLAWSNFISALDTRMKAHYIIFLRTGNDLVFQLSFTGIWWLLLI